MTLRAYLVPVDGDGTHFNAYRTKYSTTFGTYNAYIWGSGPDNRCLTLADLSGLDHTALLLNLDVVPLDPNFNIGLLDLVTLNLGAEARGFPISSWTAINMPYTTVVRRIFAMIMISQSMNGQGYPTVSIGFDDAISNYSTNALAAFYNGISICGFSDSNIVNTMTLREALLEISSQNDGNSVTGPTGNI